MDFAIQVCFYVLGIPLELLAINAILRGGVQRYPLVFTYSIALFLTTVVEMPTSLAFYAGNQSVMATLINNYYRDEGILQIAIFSVVISLIYAATSKLPYRRTLRLALIAGATLFVTISFWVHYSPAAKIGIWMTPWTRDLKFCSAILDLVLWFVLLLSREKNRTVLILSGGLGIMFTGGAIGEALRHVASANRNEIVSRIGGLLEMCAEMILLYILWQAFRKRPPANRKQQAA